MRDLGVARSDKRRSRDKGKQENRQRSCAMQENKLVQAGRPRNRPEAGGIFDLWKLTRVDCAINMRKKTEKQANCSNNGMKRERLRETGRGRRTRKQRRRQLVGFFKEWGLSFKQKSRCVSKQNKRTKIKKMELRNRNSDGGFHFDP